MTHLVKRALISVSDKEGIGDFARALVAYGYEIVSSGGTYSHLRSLGIEATKVADITGFPEILDGRVKTLHPKIHGALLARYELDDHRRQLEELGIPSIDLVVINLYPFAKTIARMGVTPAEAIEQIDIGGPAMIRASAKNFRHLTILTDPLDYNRYLDELASDRATPSGAFRLEMAQKAFQHTFSYDLKIADYLDGLAVAEGQEHPQPVRSKALPRTFRMSATLSEELRYGENPHQSANFYRVMGSELEGYADQLQGKQLSYNNLIDLEAAWRCVLDFSVPAAVIVKHTNPCGVACGPDLRSAFLRARMVDPTSAFGGIIAFNRAVSGPVAEAVNEQFAELVVAPEFEDAALAAFSKKKNLRVMRLRPGLLEEVKSLELKRLDHGLLVQDKDLKRVPFSAWTLKSKRGPEPEEVEALKMAWTIVKHVKSNAIVYADARGALGIGAGQMSRVDSAEVAIRKAAEAGLSIAGSAMASDAFFPFRDSIDKAATAGVRAVVEPGGSMRDEEVIQAADEHGICLFFTDTRHFKH